MSKLYRLFLNPLLGPMITALILFSAVFIAFTVNTGFPITAVLGAFGWEEASEVLERYTISGLIGSAFDYLKILARERLEIVNNILASLVADGVLEGVGVVVSFIPLILITLAIMAAIEDSGLGPLMAVSMHSIFSRFGLSGRAVYPLFISLGCNVPGVMASRAALDDSERLEIIASASFIPCQARLLVMLALVAYLLPANPALQALTVVGLYLGGVALYMVTALIFRRLVIRVEERPELVLELPRLRIPSARVVWWNSWSMTRHFVVRAGTVLVLLTAIVWALTSLSLSGGFADDPRQSIAYAIGSAVGGLIAPLYGLDREASWMVGFALLTGFIAKENLLASLAVLSGAEEVKPALESLRLSVAQGISILVLFTYYIPCLATVATIYGESGSAKFTALVVLYIISIALALSVIVHTALSTIAP